MFFAVISFPRCIAYPWDYTLLEHFTPKDKARQSVQDAASDKAFVLALPHREVAVGYEILRKAADKLKSGAMISIFDVSATDQAWRFFPIKSDTNVILGGFLSGRR